MFSETQNFFAFCRKWLKVGQKIFIFKIARCFRSKGNHPNPHTVTLNTFVTQGTKIIQGNIMCVSNFHMYMFGNVLKFWCYDPNLHSPDKFSCFPSIHHFLTHSCSMFTEFFLLAIGLSLRSCLEAQNTFFVIQVFLFFHLT